jgi:ribosome assembly protein 4
VSWEPLHLSKTPDSRRFASASQDATVKIWDYKSPGNRQVMSFGQHSKGVTCVKWGGEGLLYTAGKDREINVWRVSDGTLCRTLRGHAHWVNTLALNTDYVMRTGPYVPHTSTARPIRFLLCLLLPSGLALHRSCHEYPSSFQAFVHR